MKRPGFTLLEVMLLLSGIAVVAGISMSALGSYKNRNDLWVAMNQAQQGMERARRLAQTGAAEAVTFYVPEGRLFKGSTYPPGEGTTVETYPMPDTVRVTGHPLLVTYSGRGGIPSEEGEIIFRNIEDDEGRIVITLNVEKQVMAATQGESTYVCKDGVTQMVASEAVAQTLIAQGATYGSCPGASSVGGGASSVSSAPVSSAPASSAASSAPAGSQTCGNFTMNGDKLITTTAASNVTFINKQARITFGLGGPAIPVHVCYSTNGGNILSPMFGGGGNCRGSGQAYGNAVAPLGTDTRTISIPSGKEVTVRVNGKYRLGSWLAFHEIFDSYPPEDNQGHIVALRNGDTVPNYPKFGTQLTLREYLASQGMMNASNQLTVNACDVLFVTELGSLGTAAADFQDDVLLAQFR